MGDNGDVKGIVQRVRDVASDLGARLHITAGKPSESHPQLEVVQRDRPPYDFGMGPDYNPQHVWCTVMQHNGCMQCA